MIDLPLWAQVVVVTATVVTALLVLWNRLVHPFFQFVLLIERVLPAMAVISARFPEPDHLDEWLEVHTNHRSWVVDRITAIERAIDHEHPPPRDWDWKHPPERREQDVGPPKADRRN